MASGSGWFLLVCLAGGGCRCNLWVWLVVVVVWRYIDFLILLIPTPLVNVLFCSSIPTFCSFFIFFILYQYRMYQLKLLTKQCISHLENSCNLQQLNLVTQQSQKHKWTEVVQKDP